MGSLDTDLLFTNIPFEETIKICTNNLFENNNVVLWFEKKVNLKVFYFSNQRVVFYI